MIQFSTPGTYCNLRYFRVPHVASTFPEGHRFCIIFASPMWRFLPALDILDGARSLYTENWILTLVKINSNGNLQLDLHLKYMKLLWSDLLWFLFPQLRCHCRMAQVLWHLPSSLTLKCMWHFTWLYIPMFRQLPMFIAYSCNRYFDVKLNSALSDC